MPNVIRRYLPHIIKLALLLLAGGGGVKVAHDMDAPRLARVEAECDSLRQQLNTYQNRNERLEAEKAALNTDVLRLEREKGVLESEVAKITKEMEYLQAEVLRLMDREHDRRVEQDVLLGMIRATNDQTLKTIIVYPPRVPNITQKNEVHVDTHDDHSR